MTLLELDVDVVVETGGGDGPILGRALSIARHYYSGHHHLVKRVKMSQH